MKKSSNPQILPPDLPDDPIDRAVELFRHAAENDGNIGAFERELIKAGIDAVALLAKRVLSIADSIESVAKSIEIMIHDEPEDPTIP